MTMKALGDICQDVIRALEEDMAGSSREGAHRKEVADDAREEDSHHRPMAGGQEEGFDPASQFEFGKNADSTGEPASRGGGKRSTTVKPQAHKRPGLRIVFSNRRPIPMRRKRNTDTGLRLAWSLDHHSAPERSHAAQTAAKAMSNT